jgi:hypothetical protein
VVKSVESVEIIDAAVVSDWLDSPDDAAVGTPVGVDMEIEGMTPGETIVEV